MLGHWRFEINVISVVAMLSKINEEEWVIVADLILTALSTPKVISGLNIIHHITSKCLIYLYDTCHLEEDFRKNEVELTRKARYYWQPNAKHTKVYVLIYSGLQRENLCLLWVLYVENLNFCVRSTLPQKLNKRDRNKECFHVPLVIGEVNACK